ncbi:hydantoinase/oxoprolinase family protein [Rhodococcus sp. BP-349]|uniref:hydantoinase/oxoprolinase family protein n=1 Tax=unclassified Rhodococcus (in: high G+C Gram-positive bacteria) TaxID=192944 RepID=UPI001C9B4BEA|nr:MULTISPECIES: hydantoinase/oxoprolinase family protein [unclassified Rhodococcus (in: high G+C Gram-positive bacteria)]MBY6537310.1 hydantoinase/oxoprolinase family protein [Rhodococcus sp. BP-363]MBY6541647.1 hydantoinase/oxoprolinase family protein [Rhodococcus sp. BP-369]MBY6560877.1 hydantoinase/oxoprolinase family protein [Rhodococcus sp. BP-370]MBY6575169.1 hydantoinase/oxoprolinase family protein [Rhodococcus sp. BP-364]MBY6584470.1 hydantoinase/oxoprolinase family protein [Rhodococc
MRYRLGVDVGGTFTDVLLLEETTGTTFRAKTPSTPADQSIGVLNGIAKVCAEAEIEPSEIGQVLHGTTVATNAILQGRGARVGLVTTDGFRQVLQIARSFVPGGLAGWIIWPKPEPLAALENTVEVVGRLAADGSEITPLDEEQARAQLRRLAGAGIEALTISLINSYANDAHEKQVAAWAESELPGIPVSISSQVLPEMREYERTLTTVANSYVQPEVSRYVRNLDRSLQEKGITAPLSILRSDGGLVQSAKAAESPVSLLLSGPAGGVTGAVWFAEQAGYSDFLTFDMGGTSTDVALVLGGEPRIGRETKVGDLAVRATSVDVRTVGAGGGSIAHVPELTKALRVGPQSAGADPGPAAYGNGGTEPTVTDANVVLGYLPAALAGGEVTLDVDASRTAVATIADAIGLGSPEEAASGIVDIVNENMFGALRLVSVQQGYDPRDFALVSFGGAGPLHANALGRLTGAWPVIVPPSPGVLCAYGDATTCVRDESARTMIRAFSDTDDAELRTALAELATSAAARLSAEGVPTDQQTAKYQVDLRYQGQGFEIPVDLDASALESGDLLSTLGTAFDTEHERLFSFLLKNEREVINLRVTVSGPRPDVAFQPLEEGGADPSAALVSTNDVWMDGEYAKAGIYDRAKLLAGNVVEGPAVITEMDSTTLVLSGHAATVHSSASLLIAPR